MTGKKEDYNEREPALAWDTFLRRQFYRAGVAVSPYALVRAVGYDFPISEAWEVALAPAVLGGGGGGGQRLRRLSRRRSRADTGF